MPYSKGNMPDQVKGMPKAAQEMWMGAFNGAMKDGKSEEECAKIAWAAVKTKYRKDGDAWVAREAAKESAHYRVFVRVTEAQFDMDKRVLRNVKIIEPGISKNRRVWESGVLEKHLPLLEGVPCYDGHQETMLAKSKPSNLLGYWRNPRYDATRNAGVGDLHFFDSAVEVIDKARQAHESGMPDLLGVSVDIAEVQQSIRRHSDGRLARYVEGFAANPSTSIDLVVGPSAGGRLFESETEGDPEMDELEKLKVELEEQKALVVSLQESAKQTSARESKGADDELKRATEAFAETQKQLNEMLKATQETTQRAQLLNCQTVLTQRCTEAKLPAVWQKIVDRKFGGRVFETQELDDELKFIAERITEAAGAVNLPTGIGSPTVGTEQVDKLKVAMDGFFNPGNQDLPADWWSASCRGAESKEARIPRFRSFHEAYYTCTGERPSMGGPNWNKFLRGTRGYDANDRIEQARESLGDGSIDRAMEALTTSSWAEILGDSITRRLVAEYRLPQWQEWRQMASAIVPIQDFRTNRRVKMGSYATLETVTEGDNYPTLTSPTDKESTYTLAKKGATDSITMETVANDDVGAIQRLPVKLARSAKLTLARYIYLTVMAGCETYVTYAAGLGDTDYLSTTTKGNNGSTTLNSSTLATAVQAMRSMTAYGNTSDVIGVVPKFLVYPNELEQVANDLTGLNLWIAQQLATGGTAAYTGAPPNKIYNGILPVCIDLWTDADAWCLIADPASCPTFEVGFYQGREEPELFTQDQPNVGSVFDADKIIYKVRHIWGFAWLDWRSFYGAVP